MSYARPLFSMPVEYLDINEAIAGLAFTGGPGNKPAIIALNGTGMDVAAFDAASTEEVSTVRELQHDYAEGLDFSFHIHWMPTTANLGNVVWGVEYDLVADGAVAGASSVAPTVVVAAPGVAWQMQFALLATVSIPTAKIGNQLFFRIFRLGGDITDTYPNDAAIATFGIHYPVNSFGSRSVAAK